MLTARQAQEKGYVKSLVNDGSFDFDEALAQVKRSREIGGVRAQLLKEKRDGKIWYHIYIKTRETLPVAATPVAEEIVEKKVEEISLEDALDEKQLSEN